MKLIAPLWSDPAGWAEGVAKTKLRVIVWTIVHALFVSGGLSSIYWLAHKLPADLNLGWFPILMGAFPIAFIGVVFPAMYLYAMHRLLKMLRAPVPEK
jgi:hypothetical protein